MGAPYIYDISRLRVKDLHSATYIYVVRRLRVKSPFTRYSFRRISGKYYNLIEERLIAKLSQQNMFSIPKSQLQGLRI